MSLSQKKIRQELKILFPIFFNHMEYIRDMSKAKTVNPFEHLPEDKLKIIRRDYEKGKYRSKSFESHLKSLHEDDLIPEEVLDIIESRNNDKGETKTLRELLQELNEL